MPNKFYEIVQGPAADKPLYVSELNTPVYSDVTFIKSNTNEFETQTYTAVLCTISQKKNIVTTEIPGRDGTIKEYTGLSDYIITINGVITGRNGVHPTEQVARLKKMLDSKESIPVASAWLQSMGIYNVTVQDYTLEQDPGGYSYQKFSITCLSDMPVEFAIAGI